MRRKHNSRFRQFIAKLDSLHWCMGLSILIVATAGWFAACECEKARLETQRVREQFIHFMTTNQSRPMAPDHLK